MHDLIICIRDSDPGNQRRCDLDASVNDALKTNETTFKFREKFDKSWKLLMKNLYSMFGKILFAKFPVK